MVDVKMFYQNLLACWVKKRVLQLFFLKTHEIWRFFKFRNIKKKKKHNIWWLSNSKNSESISHTSLIVLSIGVAYIALSGLLMVNSFHKNGPIQSLLASVSTLLLLSSTSIPTQVLIQSLPKLMKMLQLKWCLDLNKLFWNQIYYLFLRLFSWLFC